MVMTLRTVVMVTLLGMAAAHQMLWGNCREVKPFPNFSPDRFNGTWYVIKKTVTTSRCFSTIFNWQGDDIFKVHEISTPILSDILPFRATVTNEGTFTMDAKTPAKMKLSWDGNLLKHMISTYFVVVDTDYDNYAVDIECQSWKIFKRISVTILSRTDKLSQEIIDKVEKMLEEDFEIDISRLSTVDQSKCFSPDEVDYKVNIDENGLSFLGLLNDKKLLTLDNAKDVDEYLGITDPTN
ncbi:apolipoprotein D-like [Homarus americanus]|uniref:apolipoprotein D-like n=1 Tax=Homarus americanus TaxID=6706 RepID=UPI001C468EB1|nr:apolipoprotein D-like [Homarus americanus]